MRRVHRVVQPLEKAAHDLALYAGVLERFERERFTSSHLRALRQKLDTSGVSPSRRIAQLGRLADWLSAQHNQLFALIAPLLLWTTQLAFAIEAWRATVGPAIARPSCTVRRSASIPAGAALETGHRSRPRHRRGTPAVGRWRR